MNDITNLVTNMSDMKTGNDLIEAMSVIPEYNESIRSENQVMRLTTLSDIYRLYLP